MKKVALVFAVTGLVLMLILWFWIPRFSPSPRTNPQTVKIPDPILAAIPAQFTDASLFLSPIRHTTSSPWTNTVTGITVPHHLLASDLIVDTFAAASTQHYDQIIVMSPDHFFLGSTIISVTDRDWLTVFGKLTTKTTFVNELKKLPNVSRADFFYREHGLQAEMPFIKHYWPNTPVIGLAIKETATKSDLDPLVEILKKNLTAHTLIVQSTDFSHYLPANIADKRDSETLAVLKKFEPSEIFTLHQPNNLDSTAAQYIQMRLQKEFFHSSLTILNHRNSQAYTREYVEKTTSYITQVYSHD